MEPQNNETKKRKQKFVCEYFERSNGNEENIKGKCNHCSKVHDADPSAGGTSTKQHSKACKQNPNNLKDVNGEGALTQKVREAVVKMVIIDALPFSFAESEGFMEFIKAVNGSSLTDTTKVRKALAKMIIIEQLRFSFVNNEGFKELVEAVCPGFSIPSSSGIARDCCDYFLRKKTKLRKLFKNNKQRVCLTAHIWTSKETIDYMCLSAQYIGDDWTLHNKIINFRSLFSCNGDEIGRTIIECLEEWGVENVLTIAMDNAPYNDVVISFLKSRLPNLISNVNIFMLGGV